MNKDLGSSIKKSRKIEYNIYNKMNTKSKWHLTTIPLKKADRAGIPKKNQWEYMMGICDPERPGHYVKRGMIRLGTRNEHDARNRAITILKQAEEAQEAAIEEKARQALDRCNLRTFILTEVWKENSPYVLDRAASGHKLGKAYIAASRQRIKDYFLPWAESHNVILLSDLGKAKLREWRNWLYAKCQEDNKAASLVNNVRVSISTALGWAEACELIDINPCLSVDKVKEDETERQPYTKDEVLKLFKAKWPDERCRVAFMVAVTTGLRLGELQGLRWANVDIIDPNNAHLDVIEQYQEYLHQGFILPKSRKPRLNVYIRKDVAEALEKLRKGRPFHLCVFPSEVPGIPMDRNIFNRGLKAGAKAAGVTLGDRLWHNARHTYLTLLASVAGIEDASKAVGHSSSKVTQNYIHETAEGQNVIRFHTDHLFDNVG